MDYYRVPKYSRKEIVMTFNSNTPNPSTSTTACDYQTVLSALIYRMAIELTRSQVWSIVEHTATIVSNLVPEFPVNELINETNLILSKAENAGIAPTTNPSTPTTSTTGSKESNLKGDNNVIGKEAAMATNKTTTEAGELIASFTKNSLGDKLPKEYSIITGIVEAIPVIGKAVKSALDLALIRAILTGDYPQLLNLERDGNTISNVKAVIAAFTNNKDEVTINDLIKFLKYGSYDCHMDEEGRIAATLLYIKLYNK